MARRPRFFKNKLSSPRCSGNLVAKETQTCWRCTISGLVWGINWLIVAASSRQDFFLRPKRKLTAGALVDRKLRFATTRFPNCLRLDARVFGYPLHPDHNISYVP